MCATVAPWALATGMLVSFTATASQDADRGLSAVPFQPKSFALPEQRLLVPPARDLAIQTLHIPGLGLDRIVTASLGAADPAPYDPAAEGWPPKSDLKKSARGEYPEVARENKGDPLVGLRPTLSRQGLSQRYARGSAANMRAMVFREDEVAQPAAVLLQGTLDLGDAKSKFEPWRDEAITLRATAPASPNSHKFSDLSYDPRRPPNAMDGGTPSVPRAVSLGSTTPAEADAMPVEIAAAPVSPGGKSGSTMIAKGDDGRPQYASLIDPQRMSQEQRCLAEAIYFEARNEPEAGQAAVAQVVLNRVKSGLYPEVRLRCRLPEPPPLPGVPVLVRVRRQVAAHQRAGPVGDGRACRPRRDGRQDLSGRCRRRDALPRRLRAPALVAQAEEDGRDRPPHLLQAEARTDVMRIGGHSLISTAPDLGSRFANA